MKTIEPDARVVFCRTRPRASAGARVVGMVAGTCMILFGYVLCTGDLYADTADVVDAKIVALGDGRYRIDATVSHPDTGWDHYANAWSVHTVDGTLLGTRELAHPHVQEQPFTRSLTLEIPHGIEQVVIRARDSVHGDGGASVELDVPSEP